VTGRHQRHHPDSITFFHYARHCNPQHTTAGMHQTGGIFLIFFSSQVIIRSGHRN
jgi:hypothetical protein